MSATSFIRSRWVQSALAAIVGAAVLLFLHTSGKVVHLEWLARMLWIAPAGIAAYFWQKKKGVAGQPVPSRLYPLLTLLLFLVLALVSSVPFSKWFYYLGWLPSPGACLKSGMDRFILLTALLTLVLALRPLRSNVLAWSLYAVCAVLCAHGLWSGTHGMALYRDDHPSFLFRLWEFARTFPSFLNYNPYWNGGTVDFVNTTTGTNAAGLILYPLWKFFPIHEVYTYGIALMFLVLVPLLTAGAIRLMGGNRTASGVAAVLSLGVSQYFFLWMLNFGTIGASLATAFVVPVSACLFRVVWMDRREKWLGAALVLSVLFLILWPAGVIMLAPIALTVLVHVRRWSAKKILFLAVCGVILLALYSRPLMLILFQKGSPLAFVMGKSAAGATAAEGPSLFTMEVLTRGWQFLHAHLVEFHPVLPFFGIGGLILAAPRGIRSWSWPILLGFAVLTGWGREWKPDMQLERMAIPLAFAMIPPAAFGVARLLQHTPPRWVVVRAALAALLMLGGMNLSKIYANKGIFRYTSFQGVVREFADWIRDHTTDADRILFAGRTVHGFGGGHVAYLPVYTGREMLACDYYHFPPKLVEYEYPPAPYWHNPEGIFRFMELYNATVVITFHDQWKKFFRSAKGQYEEIRTIDRWTLFRVRREPSFFFKGSGSVTADFNRIDVTLDNPEEEAAIKYNWDGGLKATPPAELYPVEAGPNVTFIGIKAHGQTHVHIRY